jgi:hypothetical protein
MTDSAEAAGGSVALPPRFLPFDGLCLRADDLRVAQEYAAARLRRHVRQLAGAGVVAGLVLRVGTDEEGPIAWIGPGYGLTHEGDGLGLDHALAVPLPAEAAALGLWLVREEVEGPDDREVYDSPQRRAARGHERVRAMLRGAHEAPRDSVLVGWVDVRDGVPTARRVPVPRAGLTARRARSLWWPVMRDLVRQLEAVLDAFGREGTPLAVVSAALGAAEVALLDEGAEDRVLIALGEVVLRRAHAAFSRDVLAPGVGRALQEAVADLVGTAPGPDAADAAAWAWAARVEQLVGGELAATCARAASAGPRGG